MKRTTLKWTLLTTTVLGAILIPFALFGEAIDAWVMAYLRIGQSHPVSAAWVLGGLLAGDILLPTPSSIISTACGTLLGFLPGTLVSALGMSLSALAGYTLGRCAEGPVVERWIGTRSAARLQALTARYGVWAVILTRPIPILAEAMALFAGLGRFPPLRFLLLSVLANLGISALYAFAGSRGASSGGLLLALLAALLLPGLGLLLARILMRRRPLP